MITFFLMNLKGLNVLKSIISSGKKNIIKEVISSQDKNVINDYYLDIVELCESNSIIFFNKNNIKNISFDYGIAIGWRWMIKNNKNLIVLHDSLLPKNRGFSPLVTSIISGDERIGVTALWACENYDEGDIISSSFINIEYPIKIQKAIELISECYSDLVLYILNIIEKKQELPRIKQDESLATYCLWRDEEDLKINWNDSASIIVRHIDAVGFPYNGAYFVYNDLKYIVHNAIEICDKNIENRTPGKIFKIEEDGIIIVCKTGLVKLTDIFLENKDKIIFNKLKVRLK